MAEGFASGTANSWLGVLGNGASAGTTYTGLAGNYGQIHTANPGAAGTTAISAGDNTRKAIGLAAPSGGSRSLTGAAVVWTHSGGSTETITALSLHTASSAGTFVLSGALTVPKSWDPTDTLTLATLSISVTPIAS